MNTGMGGGEGTTYEEMMQTMKDNKEEIAKIEKETVTLQDVEIDDNRKFSSSLWTPTDGRAPVYVSVDTDASVLDSSLDKLKELSENGEVDQSKEETAKMMLDLLKMLAGGKPVSMSFAVTVGKDHAELRVMKQGDVVNSMMYKNVKTADDLLKLVSFHDERFVEPLLKDFDTLKELLEGGESTEETTDEAQ